MTKLCTLEGPFDYSSAANLEKLSKMFDVNDALGQMVYGGRWPLVKRAACKIATDAIDSPFIFQIRNFDAPEAVALDPVLSRIWGPNDRAGAAILGRSCWAKLKGCLGAPCLGGFSVNDCAKEIAKSDIKFVQNVANKIARLDEKTLKEVYMLLAIVGGYMDFETNFNRIKKAHPAMNDGEIAVEAFFGTLANYPKPTGEKTETAALAWEWWRAAIARYLERKGLWNDVEAAARARSAAVASAQAAQSFTEQSLRFYAQDTAKMNVQDAEAAAEREADRTAAEIAQTEKAGFDFSKLILPAVGIAALAFLG